MRAAMKAQAIISLAFMLQTLLIVSPATVNAQTLDDWGAMSHQQRLIQAEIALGAAALMGRQCPAWVTGEALVGAMSKIYADTPRVLRQRTRLSEGFVRMVLPVCPQTWPGVIR
jgi:hypothetical protein